MTINVNSNQAVSWLEMPAENLEDPGLKKLFGKAEEMLGFVPNVFIGYCIRPTHFSHWFNHFREIMQGESELTPTEREMIAVVVSSLNRCLYCLVSHGAELRIGLKDPILGEQLVIDYRRADLDARTVAMLDYAAKITKSSADCSAADIEQLRSHGFSDVGIFDIAETAAMYNFTNRLASSTGMLPNREYYGMGR